MPKNLFKKGNKGKPVGAVNESTKLMRSVREVVLDTFNKLQADPQHNLESFAKKSPKEFYLIAAKLIPTEIQAKVEQLPSPQIILNVEKPK